ncbi:MAG: mandelate racemase/muconate lactonizing enzyme family protein [Stellaceae bacterium]
MKVTKLEPILADRFLFVRVETDAGISGIGESGAWGHVEASAAAIRKFGEYLVGKPAGDIEHHWNVMQRAHHFTGAAITGAISAIDIALWDVKGKRLGVPIYDLLGGAIRNKARLYAHVLGATIDELVARLEARKAEGYNAVGHLNPFLDESEEEPYFRPHAAKMAAAIENVRRLREAAGTEVDLCIEIHRRLTPPEAIAFGRAIEPFHPMFYEDPLRPYSPDAMAEVADHIPIPVATGERFTSLHAFQALLARKGVQFLRPCICICGGITAGKKIAALAEAFDAQIVPHNPLSPVGLAASLQLAACIPNFAIQEYPCGADGRLKGDRMFTGLSAPRDGFIAIPTAPGLGIELVPEVERIFPPVARPIRMRPHIDGSMVDQ